MDAYQATFEVHPSHLHARVSGPRTPENAIRFLEEVYAACQRTGHAKVLLEMAFTGPSLGVSGVLKVVEARSRDGAKLRKIAYVEASPDGPGKAQFAETAAVNRAVNVRLFPDVAQAVRWLDEVEAA
ncbi:MAG: hypothetical protein FIB05_00605 [Betaproteobacteria bacterium]|nr:hypothetical protein [Betaproteobacteria bacterium]PWB62237.1 MAG: hypothetical protein C3F16_07000 [Betaproteobacteria bacterium]